jgi:hypothetical protein
MIRYPWLSTLGVGGALLSAILLLAGTAAAAEWEKVSDRDGLLVERRAVTGSAYPEYRATARSPLSPSVIFDTLWRHAEYMAFIPHLKRLDLLSDTGDERLTYEQVAVPLARDRDYTVRVRKRVDLATQRYEITFTTDNEAGPPPDSRHVRVPSIRGGWIVEPGIDGQGSILRYDVQSEPGGAIPAWIANRAQRGVVADLVRSVLARALLTNGHK